jgi:hypothetical protein
MYALLLAVALAGGSGRDAEAPPAADVIIAPDFAAERIAAQLQTGSLLFSEGDCLAIKVYAGGPYTHVALAVIENNTPIIYDSMNGCGVRKQPLAEYLVTQAPDSVTLFQPREPLTVDQAAQLRCALESRLGTHYAVWHHLSGERSQDGVHCSEYATDALMAIGLVHAERPPKVSPSSLADGIALHDVYTQGETISLLVPIPEEVGDNWCEQLWIDTRLCCSNCCRQMSAWFLCR